MNQQEFERFVNVRDAIDAVRQQCASSMATPQLVVAWSQFIDTIHYQFSPEQFDALGGNEVLGVNGEPLPNILAIEEE